MEENLRKIIATIAETSPDFSGEADLRDALDVDSYRAVEIVFEIERTFDIKIPDNRFGEMRTLNSILSLVKSLKGAHAQG
jgi:acyl carrier protein